MWRSYLWRSVRAGSLGWASRRRQSLRRDVTDIDPDWLGLEAKKPRLLLSATIEVQVQNPDVIDDPDQAISVPDNSVAGSLAETVVANDELGDRLAFTISNPDELKMTSTS